ncbi:hypothetical protein BJ170DRAFT_679473 [Xylariales sp. AK1849]|nr:hypothetical protein BJ170DRAFT_679473 [Xylariales sp. AK1849]
MAVPLQSVVVETVDPELPTTNELHEYPWKYIGYKDFTSYVASDPDFFAVRRFDRLHTRAILTLQAQLVEIEEKLDSLDKRYSSRNVKLLGIKSPQVIDRSSTETLPNDEDEKPQLRDINNSSVRDDLPERARLVAEMTLKLAEYDSTLVNYSSVRSLGTAPVRNVKNIERWFRRNAGAITDLEAQFINHKADLVAVSRPKSILRQWFEHHVVYKSRSALSLFQKLPNSILGPQDQGAVYTISDDAVDFVASIAIFATASAILVLPLWILQTLQKPQWKLAVITIFVFLCLAFLSVATIGRPFEKLTATAGYSAVLVVFLQFGNAQ